MTPMTTIECRYFFALYSSAHTNTLIVKSMCDIFIYCSQLSAALVQFFSVQAKRMEKMEF